MTEETTQADLYGQVIEDTFGFKIDYCTKLKPGQCEAVSDGTDTEIVSAVGLTKIGFIIADITVTIMSERGSEDSTTRLEWRSNETRNLLRDLLFSDYFQGIKIEGPFMELLDFYRMDPRERTTRFGTVIIDDPKLLWLVGRSTKTLMMKVRPLTINTFVTALLEMRYLEEVWFELDETYGKEHHLRTMKSINYLIKKSQNSELEGVHLENLDVSFLELNSQIKRMVLRNCIGKLDTADSNLKNIMLQKLSSGLEVAVNNQLVSLMIDNPKIAEDSSFYIMDEPIHVSVQPISITIRDVDAYVYRLEKHRPIMVKSARSTLSTPVSKELK